MFKKKIKFFEARNWFDTIKFEWAPNFPLVRQKLGIQYSSLNFSFFAIKILVQIHHGYYSKPKSIFVYSRVWRIKIDQKSIENPLRASIDNKKNTVFSILIKFLTKWSKLISIEISAKNLRRKWMVNNFDGKMVNKFIWWEKWYLRILSHLINCCKWSDAMAWILMVRLR